MKFIKSSRELREQLSVLTEHLRISVSQFLDLEPLSNLKSKLKKVKNDLQADWIELEDLKRFDKLTLEQIKSYYEDSLSKKDLTELIYYLQNTYKNSLFNFLDFLKIINKLLKTLLKSLSKNIRDQRFFIRKIQLHFFQLTDDYHLISIL